MKTPLDIPSIDDNRKFINYEILGEDNDFNYKIGDFFFTACNHEFSQIHQFVYEGTASSNILIARKNQGIVDVVVCDCICSEIPRYNDNIIIEWRDINISPNRNQWNNHEIIHIFKNILGATLQYPVPVMEQFDVLNEIKLYDKLEYIMSFITGRDFGISICKYINNANQSIELYVIRNRTTNNSANYQVLGENIIKIKNLIENCDTLNKIENDYYKETISSLSKMHSESDIIIKWAILIITFERFLNNILLEKGVGERIIKKGNLKIKLGMYNKKINKKIPKAYLNDNKLITDYRNPLMHGGKLNETNIDNIVSHFFKYTDLLYSLLLESMGYNDDIILSSNSFSSGKILL
ncbi:hypothetical protein AGMMS49944_18620 [Spirochaetia bacterium]|nr:hypothetical protein AGMMS49944_18620 [Spirochaetia bacterium]